MKNLKGLLVIVVLAFFVLLGVSSVQADTLFTDGFESGNLSLWTATSSPYTINGVGGSPSTNTGTKRVSVEGIASDSALLKAQSTVGFENVALSYWYRVSSALEAADHVYVEWSPDGGTNWNLLVDYTGIATPTTYTQATFNLGVTGANNANLQFRLRATLGSASDEMFFDDVELSGTVIAPPEVTVPVQPTEVRTSSRAGDSRREAVSSIPVASMGEVLGASITPETAQIALIKSQLALLIQQLIALFQAELESLQ